MCTHSFQARYCMSIASTTSGDLKAGYGVVGSEVIALCRLLQVEAYFHSHEVVDDGQTRVKIGLRTEVGCDLEWKTK